MAGISLRVALVLVALHGVLARQAWAEEGGDRLPVQPSYKGEVRRGPDGRLIVLEDSPVSTRATAAPATMVVGNGEKVTSISEAARLARDGEVIEIRPGDYRGQAVVWTQDNLVIRGGSPREEGDASEARRPADKVDGARPVMIADGKSAEDRSLWVVRGGNVRIENIEFRGARGGASNGAGIRFERGRLSVYRCAFFDNEVGILTADREDMTLAVSDSEFGAAPEHPGRPRDLLNVGAIGRLSLTGSRFERGYLGRLVTSRARESDVRYNLIVDGDHGRASYELAFPNGGVAYVIGNVVGQSESTEDGVMIAYGSDGPRWPANALFLAHNTLLNDYHAGDFLRVWSERFPGGVETWLINNLTVGYGELDKPALGRFEGNATTARRDLLLYGGVPLRVNSVSPLRGSVRIPGDARGVSLLPEAEFSFPSGTRRAHPGNALAPGAFQ